MWDHRLNCWKTIVTRARMARSWPASATVWSPLRSRWQVSTGPPSAICPRGRMHQKIQAAQEVAFARPRRPDHRDDLPLGGVQADPAQHLSRVPKLLRISVAFNLIVTSSGAQQWAIAEGAVAGDLADALADLGDAGGRTGIEDARRGGPDRRHAAAFQIGDFRDDIGSASLPSKLRHRSNCPRKSTVVLARAIGTGWSGKCPAKAVQGPDSVLSKKLPLEISAGAACRASRISAILRSDRGNRG